METNLKLADKITWPDEELEKLRIAVLAEQERRERIASAPSQLAEFARSAITSGCDPQVLVDTVTDVAASTLPRSE